MSQELQILRCYNCETFQVHIVKKVPKWSCKMCGEKQSQKKVFFRGPGKECRLKVQDLNLKQQYKSENNCEIIANYEFEDDHHTTNNDLEKQSITTKEVSKWNDFITQQDISCGGDNGDNDTGEDHYSFEQPKKIRKCLQNKSSEDKCSKKNTNPLNVKLTDFVPNNIEGSKSIEKEKNLDVKLVKSSSNKWHNFLGPLEKDETISSNNEDNCTLKERTEENSDLIFFCNNFNGAVDKMRTKNNLIDIEETRCNLYSQSKINQSASSNFKTQGTKPKNIFEEIDCDLDHTTNNDLEKQSITTKEISKWNDFITQQNTSCGGDNGDNDTGEDHYSFKQPKKIRKCLQNKNREDKCSKKNTNPLNVKMTDFAPNNIEGSKSIEKENKLDVKLVKPSSNKWHSFLDPLEKEETESISSNNEHTLKERTEENSGLNFFSNNFNGTEDKMRTKNNLIDGEETRCNLYSQSNVSSNFKTQGTKRKNIFEEIDSDLDI